MASKPRRCVVFVCVLLGIAVNARAQEPAPEAVRSTPNTLRLVDGTPRSAAKVTDLAWLAGNWTGEGLGGQVDEAWSAPAAGAMVGHFRLVREGKTVFYEALTLLEVDNSVELRLKHLNPDMTSWEEKDQFVTFRLIKHDGTAAYFGGLTCKRVGDDGMEAYLALRDRATNIVREERFIYRRVRLWPRRGAAGRETSIALTTFAPSSHGAGPGSCLCPVRVFLDQLGVDREGCLRSFCRGDNGELYQA
jgi:hypothetical protein